MVEQKKFPTPAQPDTTSQSEISPSDSPIKIITLGKSSLKDVADSLDGELNRSWATGWSEDPVNFGDIKFHYPNAQRTEDCPLFCKAFTLQFGPDIGSFVKPESGVSKEAPPKKALIHLEEVDGEAKRKTVGTMKLNPFLNWFLSKDPEKPGLFIPLDHDYRGKHNGSDGRITFAAISSEIGLGVFLGRVDESGESIPRFDHFVPQEIQGLLIAEAKRIPQIEISKTRAPMSDDVWFAKSYGVIPGEAAKAVPDNTDLLIFKGI